MAEPNLQVILQQLQAEKGVDLATLLDAIRTAIESAARKSINSTAEIAVDVDLNSPKPFRVFEIRSVVETVADRGTEMTLAEAQGLNPEARLGDRLKMPAEPRNFGRIAAQTAKQVIIQRMKDAERDNVYGEFKQREGELVTGVVKRVSHGNIIVAIGRAEAVLPQSQQSPRENFKPGDRIRALLIEVEKAARGPQVILSRSHPDLVRQLFDMEVPEIYDGTIEIRAIAREAGSRTKIAVWSNDSKVDAVGACVGMKGSRVRAVVEELCGEKIDIVRWSSDPAEFCGNALNPADIVNLMIDTGNKSVTVVVPHDQLSLAIGKRGQNARLASRLIGWNIDIKSDVELAGGDAPASGTSDPAALDALHEPKEEAIASIEETEAETGEHLTADNEAVVQSPGTSGDAS